MKTDTDIRSEGIRALIHVLGTVEAERFIALIKETLIYSSRSELDLRKSELSEFRAKPNASDLL